MVTTRNHAYLTLFVFLIIYFQDGGSLGKTVCMMVLILGRYLQVF